MTQISDSGRLSKYSKARDLVHLMLAASLVPALIVACVYFAPDSMWGRPVSIEVIMAAYMATVGGPAMAMLLYGFLIWLTQTAPAGTARLPKGELFLCRTLSMVFGGAPMLWGLFTLVAWYGNGSGLPDTWLYISCSLQLLAYVLSLAVAFVLARRRQRDAHA